MGQTQALLEDNIVESQWSRRVAIVDGVTGRGFSYQQLIEYSKQLAHGLEQRCNIKRGSVVAIYAPNMLEWNLVLHGTQMLGGIFAPISPYWNKDEVAFQLRDSGATVLFTVPPLYDLARAAISGTSVRCIYVFGSCEGANPFGCLLQNEGWMPEDDLLEAFDDTDVCLYCYTPTGGGELQRFEANHIEILSSVTSLIGNVDDPEQGGDVSTSINVFALEETDKIAGVLPFWRSEGLVGVLLHSNFAGVPVYTFDHFSPYKILNAIDNFEINVLPFSVSMIEDVACLNNSGTNADYMPPQNDKVDRERRKSLKVVVPTQADSDENGIDLDDHVLQNFSQIF
eukprot:g13072.t1